MKDEAVERLLRGLGTVEAPSGMEGRVLCRLEERGERRANVWGWGFGIAGGIALVLVGVLMVEGRNGSSIPAQLEAAEAEHLKSTGSLSESVPRGPKPDSVQTIYPTAEAVGLTRRGTRLVTRGVAAPTHVSEARHGAPGLVARMESFPAPSEPLTEQERLLRQIALQGSEPAFELLNEETREASMAASDAEFEAFVRSAASSGRADRNLELQR